MYLKAFFMFCYEAYLRRLYLPYFRIVNTIHMTSGGVRKRLINMIGTVIPKYSNDKCTTRKMDTNQMEKVGLLNMMIGFKS